MAFTEIPTSQAFKKACGRTGPRSLFKRKTDLGPIFTALTQAEPQRLNPTMPAGLTVLRDVRKACIAWLTANVNVARASKPAVQDLCRIVQEKLTDLIEQNFGGRKMALPNKPTLKDVVNRVRDVRGSAPGDVGRRLDETYWIEKILPDHLGKGVVGQAFMEWKTQQAATRLNIQDWLTYVYVPECEDDPYGIYFKDNTKRNMKGIAKIKGAQGVKYCDAEERKGYVLHITGGTVTDAGGDTYDTSEESTVFSGKGWAIFVMGPDDTVYANSHKADEFHHSSFLAGGTVKCGGEIQIDRGVILKITPKTGHYKAGPGELKYFLEFCQKNGVRLRDVEVCPNPFDHDKQWSPGDAVLLAGGFKPTAEHLSAAEAARKMPQRPTRPVPKPPRQQGVKDLIGKWENIAKQNS
jgi:hypothetical protein